ncbi:MAG: ATP-binding cassette domain-containing protein [Anaerolineae bacterium]|nr:ATP-binding cassette domain-containing protein [Anaerolineae bacterium]
MIRFDRFRYTYPGASQPALADVTFAVEQGELVLVTGLSGAGKSTLLRCINGLVPHFSGGQVGGVIAVAGHDPVAEGPAVLSQIVGFVFQDPESQFVVDEVADEIAFALENAAVPRPEMRARVEAVLEMMGLTPLRRRRIDTLSGGEKQRVAIAAALALRPQILLLDEPTSQLDPRASEEVLQALVRLNRQLGLTILLSEHRLERVLPYVDRMVHLPGPGQPPQAGPPRSVLRHVDPLPPLVALGRALAWEPLPLSVEEGRPFAERALQDCQVRRASSPAVLGDLEPILKVENLSFAFAGPVVLQGVNLVVRRGELAALMGRNGAGKTTLLRCIVGLLQPQEGEIALAGRSIWGRETAEVCRQAAYLPQEPDSLLFADTVAEELWVTLRNHGLQAQPPIHPHALLDRLGLQAVRAAYPRDLSVGQRQRVALGAVTVTAPRLLLLDEPTRGMDYAAKESLLALLREWRAEGMGVLLVTHDVELVAQAADRVIVLEQGRVVADGPPAEVLTADADFAPQVARLFPACGWLTAAEALARLTPPAARPIQSSAEGDAA